MRRRTLLAAAVSTGMALAGCIGGPDDGGASGGTITTEPTPEERSPTPADPPATSTHTPSASTSLRMGEPYTTSDRTTVTVAAPRVRKSIVEFTGVHTDVASIEGAQFLVVDVTTSAGVRVADLDLVVAVDGRRAPVADAARRYWVHETSNAAARQAFGFAVQAAPDPRDAAVIWNRGGDDVSWTLDAETVAALGRAPAFEVRGFEVPDEIGPGEAIEATVTVANVGDRDGTFLAELGSAAVSDQPEFAVEVPAGEVVEHRETAADVPDGADEVTVALRWGTGSMERTVRVAG